MGIRADKGRSVAKYIGGHTGMPFVRWDNNGLHSPAPYRFDLTTSKKLDNWHNQLREPRTNGLYAAIRYDYTVPTLNDAWVGMHLDDYVTLLTSHYESIQDRIKGE